MNMNNLDSELKEALREYVKDTKIATNEKIEFSKEHEDKMKKLFDDLEKAAELNETTDNKILSFNVNKFVKVAVFIILALIISMTVAPKMIAWRTEKMGLYGNNQDEYSRVLQSDISESLENKADENDKFIKFFNYLPNECKIIRATSTVVSEYVELEYEENKFSLKAYKNMNQAVDTESTQGEPVIINGKEIVFLEKDGMSSFIWSMNGRPYRLYGKIVFDEAIKIIENINYEEIEKSF